MPVKLFVRPPSCAKKQKERQKARLSANQPGSGGSETLAARMKHIASNNVEQQLFALSTLVQLGKRARHAATPQELGFVMVNETHSLVPYRQALLWRRDAPGAGDIAAISGAAVVEGNAPLALWANRAFAKLDAATDNTPRTVDANDLPESLREEWAEWLPTHGLWVPLVADPDRRLGVLLLVRDQSWGEGERHLVQELVDAYAGAWAALHSRRRLFGASLWRPSLRVKVAIAAAIFLALWLPVRLSALAPADVVPLKPAIVRAPLDGVVDHFTVEPNEAVKQGQLLLELDPRAIQNKLEVARQGLAVAEAEYRQTAQQAVFDDKSRSQLAILKGRMDQRRAEAGYAQSLLDRIHVTAPRGGIALLDDPSDWVGRPVSVGERLMEVADPNQAEIEVWLPVADAITLKSGADVDFFLNISPDAPLHATIRQASYEATLSPNGLLGYRLKAAFVDGTQLPRIGLRGTAKVYGEHVSLFYYLLRRPLAAARQLLGL